MTDLKLDGVTKALLDTATGGNHDIAYWFESPYYITNEQHLNYINSLGVYSIDVAARISHLESLEINLKDEDKTPLEIAVQADVNLTDLSDIEILDAEPGDILTWDSTGIIKNFPKPDVQYKHSKTLYATNGGGEDDQDFLNSFTNILEDQQSDIDNAAEWAVIGKAYLTANCGDKANYKITVNFVCSVSNNNRSFKFGIFCNNKEIEDFTQEFYFNKKDDYKSITIIEYIKDVKKGDIISLRATKGSGKSSTLSVYRRSIFLEELR